MILNLLLLLPLIVMSSIGIEVLSLVVLLATGSLVAKWVTLIILWLLAIPSWNVITTAMIDKEKLDKMKEEEEE